ncbi:MAG: lipopolysaccharide transport periplasmic protein LptA [Campylobacteraceae bacterium]|jgi:lipopolysaccharide export system protein LptA|nr:lipopolysaccharide transport periplasmic protein LptA [Campylobacteraceae bacterium]
MKKLVFILFLALFVRAEEVEVKAKNVYADETNRFVEFTGNATVIKGKDKLDAQKITVHIDEKGQPLKYVALGDVKVKISLNKKQYNASGNALTYDAKNQKYILEGNAFLSEVDTDRKIYGERIEADQINGTYIVNGKELKPAKFIFQIEDIK